MMNVSYETRYDGSSAPQICKVVTVDNDKSEVVTVLTLSNSDEISKISSEEIWSHMENMTDYMRIKGGELTLVEIQKYPEEGWPAIGWAYLSQINEELTQWWLYVMRRDAPEEKQVLHYH
jgi:hypothetical protein